MAETRRGPEPPDRRYRASRLAVRGEEIELTALEGARVAVEDLLPAAAS